MGPDESGELHIMRQRIPTDVIGERVASLETHSMSHERDLETHEERLDGHDAWLNQVRGSIRTMVVLWTIAVALLGFRFVSDYVAKPAGAAIQARP